ncbi:MAG: MFS transporter, partial [Thermoleophilia bacterium]|nr:MFS transporter [Thermoleophilia bacterium]
MNTAETSEYKHGPERTQWFQLGIVCAAGFVVWSGFGAILPYLPVFLQEQAHASVWLIGVVAAAYYVGTFVFSAPLGRLSDSIGRKPVIVAGVALYAVASSLFVSTTNPWWFILFRL